jgi:excisionase family DNA binding protein
MADKAGKDKRRSDLKPLGSGRRLLTTEEVAEQLGVTMRTVQRWIKLGVLPHYEFGQGKGATYRVDPQELEGFLKKHHKG